MVLISRRSRCLRSFFLSEPAAAPMTRTTRMFAFGTTKSVAIESKSIAARSVAWRHVSKESGKKLKRASEILQGLRVNHQCLSPSFGTFRFLDIAKHLCFFLFRTFPFLDFPFQDFSISGYSISAFSFSGLFNFWI